MAYGHVESKPAAWAIALDHLRTLKSADALPPGSPCSVVQLADADLAAAEVAVLDLHAPTFSAVIEKLTILWGPQLWDDTPDANHLQMVIGDLRRLSFYLP